MQIIAEIFLTTAKNYSLVNAISNIILKKKIKQILMVIIKKIFP